MIPPILEHLSPTNRRLWSRGDYRPRYVGTFRAEDYGQVHTWHAWLGRRPHAGSFVLFVCRRTKTRRGYRATVYDGVGIAQLRRILGRPDFNASCGGQRADRDAVHTFLLAGTSSRSEHIGFVQDDGGRAEAGYRGTAADCVVRAIAIATETPYQKVYDDLFALNRERLSRRRARPSAKQSASPRDGNTHKDTIRKYMKSLGWKWVPRMGIGAGCQVPVRADELPAGRLAVVVSKHYGAVVNGVVRDLDDPTRDGTRCVYGYFFNPASSEGRCDDADP